MNGNSDSHAMQRVIQELEVRSGTTLDASQNLRTLKFDEWKAKARSAEYAKVKLAARKVGAAQAGW